MDTPSYSQDPLIVARMIVVGHDCLMQAEDKFNAMELAAVDHIENTRAR